MIKDDLTDFEQYTPEREETTYNSSTTNDDDIIEIDAVVSSGDNDNTDTVRKSGLPVSLSPNGCYEDTSVDLHDTTYFSGVGHSQSNKGGNAPVRFDFERAYTGLNTSLNNKEVPTTNEEAMRMAGAPKLRDVLQYEFNRYKTFTRGVWSGYHLVEKLLKQGGF